MMNSSTRKRNSRGFTLIEVLIGILIFAIGMMALAKLQGNLARNSGDSNARTVATNIAEEMIEQCPRFPEKSILTAALPLTTTLSTAPAPSKGRQRVHGRNRRDGLLLRRDRTSYSPRQHPPASAGRISSRST